MKESRRKLKHEELTKLTLWVNDNRDYLAAKGLSQSEAAEFASKALEFDITQDNLIAVYNSAGWSWHNVQPKQFKGTHTQTRLNDLEKRVAYLESIWK